MTQPLIIGVTGAVAVGKSTFSNTLAAEIRANQALQDIFIDKKLQFGKDIRVTVVATDNFLFSNEELEKRSLTNKKGFPESYDAYALGEFLLGLKAGKTVSAPVYSHEIYDIDKNASIIVENPDVVIVEGVAVGLVIELIDLLIFLEADNRAIFSWYRDRYIEQIEKAKTNENSWYYQFVGMSNDEVDRIGKRAWEQINEPNFFENIAPLKKRADILISLDEKHRIVSTNRQKK